MTFIFCTTFALTNLTIYADSFIGNKDCGYSSFCLFMGRYVREERTSPSLKILVFPCFSVRFSLHLQ